jgi:hypothetical protein
MEKGFTKDGTFLLEKILIELRHLNQRIANIENTVDGINEQMSHPTLPENDADTYAEAPLSSCDFSPECLVGNALRNHFNTIGTAFSPSLEEPPLDEYDDLPEETSKSIVV